MNQNKVYIADCPSRGHQVAIKHIDLSSSSHLAIEKIKKEVTGMSVASSDFVVEFYCSFVQDQTLWIVMSLQEGSIRDVLKYKYPQGFQDEAVIATIIHQTLQGLNYLHEKHMIHRDIKAGNILFNKDGHIKLADFGVSAVLASHDQKCSTLAGTYHWMAPEVIDPSIAQGGYDFLADIWSLGITCIELAYGSAPYSQHRPNQVIVLILNNEPPSLEKPRVATATTRTFSSTFVDFVSRCLQHDPTKRLPANKLLGHKFVRTTLPAESMKDVLGGLPSSKERFLQQEQKIRENLNLIQQNPSIKKLSFRIQPTSLSGSTGLSSPRDSNSSTTSGESSSTTAGDKSQIKL
jgi:serine/threonine-protein kinase OSR1/STK39